MFSLIRKILFLMPPEKAHYVTLNILSMAIKTTLLGAWLKSNFHNKRQSPVQFCGLNLPNKVGLAAGFDKDARYLEVWKALGFGHAEIGTITPLPQPGNEKPRLFRLPKDRAIINRMGFNNLGLDQAIIQLKNRPKGLIIGGNIGKNKFTPNEKAVDDYLICFEKLYDFVDYFTVNVSSPNTPGLRALQDKDALLEILSVLIQKREDLTSKGRPHRPVLLKIAPDLTPGQLDDIIELKKELNFDGIIANNTTISRERLQTDASEIKQMGAGGLSGAPLKMRSSEVMRYLREHLPETPLIGVGGIMNAQDGKDRLNDGADLIQVYTGFIYAGPGLVKALAGIK
jgi:dihydroorotate dehydrogenase